MATYSTLRNGSRGEEVKKLQQALINAGYNVGSSGADGIYGANTAAAVKKFQQDNKLSVDGLAGNETLSALYKTGTNTSNVAQGSSQKDGPSPTTGTTGTSPYSSYSYDPSSNSAYQNALKALQAAQSQMTNYNNSYQSQLEEIYNKIMNREKFSYDLNSDMLYNQYKDQYVQQGKMAMMDTMGQAAALTGGYGNSYASTAGNQAYQGYLQELNNIVPELYQQALNQYNTEGQELYNQYALIGDMADDEYQKYQDSLNQYWQNLNYLKSVADDEYTRGYENWYNSMTTGASLQQKNYDNLVTLITTTGYAPTAEELKAAGMTSAQAGAYKKYYTQMLGGTGGSSGGGTRTYTPAKDTDKKTPKVNDTDDDELYAKKMDAYATGKVNGNPFLGWNERQWEQYFAAIRNDKKNGGQAAAQAEFNRLSKLGYIPENMAVHAATGVRGSSGGH